MCSGEKPVYLAIRSVKGHQVIDRDVYGFTCLLCIHKDCHCGIDDRTIPYHAYHV